ncbi:outer membrane protein assembly factor BamA [Buchnera aphidicola]|uniref:outer membrane protein assembly factor BamA n=1 Tax=Buchnera aphidicola TaxID=9 RepID=UPI0034638CC5
MFIRKLLILFFLFFSINGYAKNKWYIKNITFCGLHRVSRDTITHYIKQYNSDTISLENVHKVIYNLLETGKFKDIKVIKFKNNLIFKIKEQSNIYNINFSDHISISDNIRKRLLNNCNIKIGNRLNPNYLNQFLKILKKYYISIGKYNIDIKLIFLVNKNKIAYFKILIFEKKYAVIDKINIFGNHIISSKKIFSLFQSYHLSNFWLFRENNRYCIKKFSSDLKNLKNFYLQEGYIYFNFNKVHVVSSIDKKSVIINIYLTEGVKCFLSKIFVHGNTLLYFRKINTIIHSKIKQSCDFNQIIKLKEIIKNIFLSDGYPYVNILSYFKINNSNNNLDFYFHIFLNQRYLLNKIYFVGNKFATNTFLRSKIKHQEDTWFNIFLLMEGRKKLLETGFFKDIKLKLYNVKNKFKKIDVIYAIQENNTGNFNFGFGYGMDSGINLNINFIKNHLLNIGSKVHISILKDINQTSFESVFKCPFFNIFKYNLKGKLFYNYLKFHEVENMFYQNKRYGIETFLGFLINKKNEFNIGINYVHNNISNIKSQFSIWRYFKSLQSDYKKYHTDDIFISFFWIFKNLNHKNFYFLGNQTIFSGKITTLGSDSNFNKIELESREYFKFNSNKNLIFFIRTYFGFGNSEIFNKVLPFYENYYSGGIGSVRGFKYNSIGPKDIFYNNKKDFCMGQQYYKFCQSDMTTGGNAIIVTNLELMKTLLLNNNTSFNIITASIFLDSTAVWNTHWINSLDTEISNFFDYSNPCAIRISTGIALQWISPLGPLNFSFAYPIKYYHGDKIEPFQFNVGKIW